MVKKIDDEKKKQTTKTISSIVQDLRDVVRENDAKIARRIATIQEIVQSLRVQKTSFAERVESLVANVESFASETIAEERATDEAIKEASIIVDADEADAARFTREGRAAISFLVWKFEEICEGFGLNLEFERLDEVGGLRERGALTSESCRLREIRKAFEKLRDAYDELQETWLSETLEQEFAEETMDLLDDENVTDVETFVRDKAMDLVSPRLSLPTVADVLRLDTHDKTRAFAEYLAEYDETREE